MQKDEQGEYVWQYAMPNEDTGEPMIIIGTPSYISKNYVKRKLRPDGDWEAIRESKWASDGE